MVKVWWILVGFLVLFAALWWVPPVTLSFVIGVALGFAANNARPKMKMQPVALPAARQDEFIDVEWRVVAYAND